MRLSTSPPGTRLAVRALLVCATAIGTVAAAAGPATSGSSAGPAQASPTGHAAPAAPAPKPAWVAVTAATVWRSPSDVRRVDRLAVAARPNIAGWLRAQSVTEQRALDKSVMTQALLGEEVHVLAAGGRWTRVRVDEQRGSAYPHGIIGWVPTVQLAWTPPHHSPYPQDVRHATGAAAVAAARRLLGVPYLWGGLTRSGIDCSGLIYLVFRQMGLVLPRDAADQAAAGRSVSRGQLEPGDLVFLARGGRSTIHHVGIYVGRGLVLHAPRAGTSVTVIRLTAWTDYWGARRILPTG